MTPATQTELENNIWKILASQNGRFEAAPAIPPLVDLVIEAMAERDLVWRDFPQWTRSARNPTYGKIYKIIDNMFRFRLQKVNDEI